MPGPGSAAPTPGRRTAGHRPSVGPTRAAGRRGSRAGRPEEPRPVTARTARQHPEPNQRRPEERARAARTGQTRRAGRTRRAARTRRTPQGGRPPPGPEHQPAGPREAAMSPGRQRGAIRPEAGASSGRRWVSRPAWLERRWGWRLAHPPGGRTARRPLRRAGARVEPGSGVPPPPPPERVRLAGWGPGEWGARPRHRDPVAPNCRRIGRIEPADRPPQCRSGGRAFPQPRYRLSPGSRDRVPGRRRIPLRWVSRRARCAPGGA